MDDDTSYKSLKTWIREYGLSPISPSILAQARTSEMACATLNDLHQLAAKSKEASFPQFVASCFKTVLCEKMNTNTNTVFVNIGPGDRLRWTGQVT